MGNESREQDKLQLRDETKIHNTVDTYRPNAMINAHQPAKYRYVMIVISTELIRTIN